MKLSEAEIRYLQERYKHLMNYQSDHTYDPIDPLTYVNPEGDTLLHIAAYRGDLKSVELLVKAGMDVNQPGDMGYTALHYAYKKNKTEVYLIEREDVIKFLLEHGASPDIRSEFGTLPGEGD